MSLLKWKDNGIKSRKLWFAIFAVVAMFAGMYFVTRHEAGKDLYATFIGGIEVVAGLYLAGNVTAKWVSIKAPPDKPEKDE